MEVATPSVETIDVLLEEGGDALKSCYQCGICTASCPWNLVRSFLPRRVIHQAQLGIIDFEDEDLWLCATCDACVEQCPRGVQIKDIMRAIRRVIVELGVGRMPDSIRVTAKNIAGAGNPLGEAADARTDWTKGLDVKTFTKGTDLLYFPCCLVCYDPHMLGMGRATVGILNKMGEDFGILGLKETCCGEAIRMAGNEDLFRNLAERNIATFNENGVKKILCSSPHCYDAFKHHYSAFGADFEVIHSTQYLLGLIRDGKLKLTKELNKRVIYHDACCLGRRNGMYEEPREILKSIPGLELIEFSENRADGICCGGGAGRIWMDTKKGQRFSDLRLAQARDMGADILAVACPYCMCMFKDSQLTIDNGETVAVKDISELVWEAI